MVTIHRERGLRFVIFSDDHEPAHVHAFGAGMAKINLIGEDGAPELVWAVGMKRGEIRKAMRIVAAEQARLLECWRRIHG
ncbi:MAG: hypothetical protein QOJ94_356 [Sphingomonadales bacterium]|jgi:hypothetical protein|nr:hypothetical protein [Sphingomonadales bacterium]